MKITINGIQCEAESGEYLINVAKRNNINIPTLCHSDALPGQASCRLCIVEVVENSRSKIVASCVYPVTREIEVLTDTDRIKNMRKTIIMLLSARAPNNSYINSLRQEYGVPGVTRFKGDGDEECILCGLCTAACDKIGAGAISTVNRGIKKKVSTPFDEPSTVCIGCSACAAVCPTGAVKVFEENGKRVIWNKEFELAECMKCGERFATREQIEYAGTKTNIDTGMFFCDMCKKRKTGELFRDIYGCKGDD